MSAGRYRKKPIVIDAVQFKGDVGAESITSFGDFASQHDPWLGCDVLLIQTLEGTMTARPGDWIIRGVNGEFYPCKPDIFEKTYEPEVTYGTE